MILTGVFVFNIFFLFGQYVYSHFTIGLGQFFKVGPNTDVKVT